MSDYRAFPVLYVDDEPQNLLTFRYALEGRFSVLTASGGSEALELLARREVAVLVCDQRMPGMSGVEVCARARELRPDVARIIMTAYADLQAAIDAINQGHVLRYLTKPWKPEDLTLALDEAVELVRMRRTIGELQARVMRGSEPLLLEGALRNVASQLDAPVARLEHGAEQVGDLLDAGLGSWEETGRARQLVEHAREAQRESERPVAELRDVVQRLERGQRLVPLVPSASCDVARVARAALHVARGALGPEVKLQLLLTDTPAAGIEAADLGQALLNVLTFASQHGEPSGGRLVHVSVGASAAFVEIVVGQPVGALPAEGLARLFDPHARVAGAARGVGLALARQLLERAGGSLHAESTPQGGLQYVLRIAAADPHPLG